MRRTKRVASDQSRLGWILFFYGGWLCGLLSALIFGNGWILPNQDRRQSFGIVGIYSVLSLAFFTACRRGTMLTMSFVILYHIALGCVALPISVGAFMGTKDNIAKFTLAGTILHMTGISVVFIQHYCDYCHATYSGRIHVSDFSIYSYTTYLFPERPKSAVDGQRSMIFQTGQY